MRALPDAITKHRLRAGMMKIDLARKASLSEKYIGEIENGQKPGGPRSLKRIADALGVDMEDIADLSMPLPSPLQSSVA